MTSMTLEELQKELLDVRSKLAKMDKSSPAYRAGELIQSAILYSIDVKEKMNEGPYTRSNNRHPEIRKDNQGKDAGVNTH